jgi:hypothetical protein
MKKNFNVLREVIAHAKESEKRTLTWSKTRQSP